MELGTGICSWAWWHEVPDLVLARVCDPTKLDGVNCEFGLYWALLTQVEVKFASGCCWIGKELPSLTVEAQPGFFAELG